DIDLFSTCFQDNDESEAKGTSTTIGQTPSTPHASASASAPAKADANTVTALSDSCGYNSSTTSQSHENEHLRNLRGFQPPPSATGSATATTPSYTPYTRGENNNSNIVTSIVDVKTAVTSPRRMTTGRTSLDGFLSRHGHLGHSRDNSSSSNLRPQSNYHNSSGSSSNYHNHHSHHHHHHHHHHGVYCNYKHGRGLRRRPSKSEQSTSTQDPAARAALIQAVRQDFEDREAAKDAKIERRNQRAIEREIRRRERLEQHTAKLHRIRLRSPFHESTSDGARTPRTVPSSPLSSQPPPPLDSNDQRHHQRQSGVSHDSSGTSRGGSAGTSSNHHEGGNNNNPLKGNFSHSPSSAGADDTSSPKSPAARRFKFRRNPSSPSSSGHGNDGFFGGSESENTKSGHWY
ncbi:hypothetical protein KEM54_003824, partial [Ascosphaera aggregata]